MRSEVESRRLVKRSVLELGLRQCLVESRSPMVQSEVKKTWGEGCDGSGCWRCLVNWGRSVESGWRSKGLQAGLGLEDMEPTYTFVTGCWLLA